tara:strand:+ start:396 stop:698 length:303 start_codon:yes stop_codon:yes gene_type:complete
VKQEAKASEFLNVTLKDLAERIEPSEKQKDWNLIYGAGGNSSAAAAAAAFSDSHSLKGSLSLNNNTYNSCVKSVKTATIIESKSEHFEIPVSGGRGDLNF